MGGRRTRLWGIVLAGGEGERLQSFVQEFLGSDAPKQFCAFLGARTMVEHTLRRAEAIIPRERLLVVATAHHRRHVFASLAARPPGTVLLQPAGRDTGPGILLPLVHVLHRDPRALVAILPSDHFILPGRRFMKAIAQAAADLARHASESGDESIALLGIRPTDPEPEYGWLEPGPHVTSYGREPLRRILGFVEKPTAEHAIAMMAKGWLWNTMVVVAQAASLMKLFYRAAPELAAYFSALQRCIGSRLESAVLEEVYQLIPSMNFSSAILARHPEQLLVAPVGGVLWSDWGRQERILATLAHLGVARPHPVRMGASFNGTSGATALKRREL